MDKPRLFPRNSYAKVYDQLTYVHWEEPQSNAISKTARRPPTFAELVSKTSISVEVVDLLHRSVAWTDTLVRVWYHKATPSDQAALAQQDLARIIEGSLCCRTIIVRSQAHLPTAQDLSSPSRLLWKLEQCVVHCLCLYNMEGYYPPSCKGWQNYSSGLLQATPLLSEPLHDEITSRPAHLELTPISWIHELLIWCSLVVAEGWWREARLQIPARRLLKTVLEAWPICNDWSHLETILKRTLWCGSRGIQWKLCWDDVQKDMLSTAFPEVQLLPQLGWGLGWSRLAPP